MRYRATHPECRKKRPSPRDPIKTNAKFKVLRAIKSGLLVRPSTCSECGEKRPIQAHHEDYTKPLDVKWLCRPCHSRHHRKEAERSLMQEDEPIPNAPVPVDEESEQEPAPEDPATPDVVGNTHIDEGAPF